jgi:uncharacterized protein
MMSDDEALSMLLSGDLQEALRCVQDRGPNALIEGRPVIHWLSAIRSAEAVRSILALGGDPNLRATSGETALFSVAYAGDRQLAQVLVDAGAEADAADSSGYSALMAAAKGGHLDVVQLLVEAGASVRRTDCCGRSVLHWAVTEADSEDVVRYLLQRGAPKDGVSLDGLTPRDYAIKLGRSVSAALL